jgi:uncharacterized protein YndB with AHSA1/START domain
MSVATAPPIVVVRRRIAASAAELFDAWLDPAALAQWMRPGPIQRTTASVDARVGGRYEIMMEIDARIIPHRGEYLAIDPPRRLVFTWNSPNTGDQDTLVAVDFVAAGADTEVVITHQQLPDTARAGHERGWSSALEKLEAHFTRS